jgi:hypothetical protein
MTWIAAVGIFIVTLVGVWLVPKHLREPILLVIAGGALERGVTGIYAGTGDGWLLVGCALAYVASYIWRSLRGLRQ